jgi:hypothetical protein
MSDEIRDSAALALSEQLADHRAGDGYDDSVKPVWQSVVELGASLPYAEWDRIPADLAANFDHYLYGKSDETE